MPRPVQRAGPRAMPWLVAGAAALLVGCGPRAPLGGLPPGVAPSDLSVLLVTLDTTRADRIGVFAREMGRPAPETPRLDALAARGTRIDRAISVTPLTLPAHSTLMTGLLPGAHGVRDNGGFRLDEARQTLAEAFAASGRRTGGFVSAYVLDHKWGIAQGFERYFDDFDLSNAKDLSLGEIQRRGDETVAAAIAWLDGLGGQPFFAWVHLYDPHTPYAPPEPYASRYPGDPYDGEIAWTDELVGRLLDHLERSGRAASTLVLVSGDHGESLGEHGEADHGFFVYEATTHVPMILAGPYQDLAGKVLKAPVGQADVAPTLLELAGVAGGLEPGQGRSFVPLLEGRSDPPGTPPRGYSESFLPRLHFGWSELRSIHTERWQFVEAPRAELYDLAADPGQLTSLVERERRTLRELRDALSALEATVEPLASGSSPVEEDEETLRALAALGYVGGQSVDPDKSFRDLPDPKERLGVYNRISRARGLAKGEDPARAVPVLEGILAEAPEVVDAWFTLGNVWFRLREWDKAEAQYRKTLELRPDHDWATIGLADTFVARGRIDEAVIGYRRYLERDPGNAQIRYRLAQVLLDAGRDVEAAEAFRATLAAEPKTARAEVGLAIVAFRAKDFAASHAALDRALAIDPKAKWAHHNRALLFEEEGKGGEAIAEYRAEIALHPEATRALFNLGRLLDRGGDVAGARDAYRRAIEADDGFTVARFFLARALLATGDLDGAEREARAALEREPEGPFSPLGHFVLADVLNRKGRHAEAEREARAGQALADRVPRPDRGAAPPDA